MKNTIQIALALFISIIATSCNQPSENKETATSEVEEHQDHNESEGLQLDDGKRWAANTETTDGINNMIALLDSFSEKEDVAAYGKLSEELQSEFNLIIQKCTMKGESHNQLHNFILPMKDLFQGISSSELNTCKANNEKLRTHLDEYQKFFE